VGQRRLFYSGAAGMSSVSQDQRIRRDSRQTSGSAASPVTSNPSGLRRFHRKRKRSEAEPRTVQPGSPSSSSPVTPSGPISINHDLATSVGATRSLRGGSAVS